MYLNFVYIIDRIHIHSSFSVVHQFSRRVCSSYILQLKEGKISREMNTFARILHLYIDEIVAIQPVVGVALILFFLYSVSPQKKIVS